MAAIAAALAGVVLAGLALWRALRGRSRKVKAVAIPVTVLVVLQFYVVPLVTAGLVTYVPRPGRSRGREPGLQGRA